MRAWCYEYADGESVEFWRDGDPLDAHRARMKTFKNKLKARVAAGLSTKGRAALREVQNTEIGVENGRAETANY